MSERERYEIRGVMGPDEFHDGYPDAGAPGLNNNAYTNVMAVWVLCRAMEVLGPPLRHASGPSSRHDLAYRRERSPAGTTSVERMYVPFHDDGIISQFEGYDILRELDWPAYRRRYGDIQRLDLILEAENDSPNRYKLSKQADVVMLFYLFSSEEFGELFTRLGYPLGPRYDPEEYHLLCCTHVSRVDAMPCGLFLGLGAFRPSALR